MGLFSLLKPLSTGTLGQPQVSATGSSAGTMHHEEDVSCPPTLGQVSEVGFQGAQFHSSLHAHKTEFPSPIHAQKDGSSPHFQGQAFPSAQGQVCRQSLPAHALQVPLAAWEDVSCPPGQSPVCAAGRSAGVLQHEKDGSCPPASGQVFADSTHSSPSLIHAQEDESFPPFQGQAFLPVSGQVCGKPFTVRALQVPLSATDRSAVALHHKEDVSCPPALGQVFANCSQGAQFLTALAFQVPFATREDVSCPLGRPLVPAAGRSVGPPHQEEDVS